MGNGMAFLVWGGKEESLPEMCTVLQVLLACIHRKNSSQMALNFTSHLHTEALFLLHLQCCNILAIIATCARIPVQNIFILFP
jgi:hypothetical protein